MKKSFISTREITRISIVTALICVFAPFTFAIFGGGVPFTMQMLVLYVVILVLPFKEAFLSIFAYVSLIAMGLPVASSFTGGLGKLLGLTGGYIFGFILMPLGPLLFTKINLPKYPKKILGLIVATFFVYLIGIPWMYFWGSFNEVSKYSSITYLFTIGVLPFLPYNIFQASVALIIDANVKLVP